MFKQLAVTNRHLVQGPFLEQLEKICRLPDPPQALILREKDLGEIEYLHLAQQVLQLCNVYGIPLIIHNFWQIGLLLQCPLHLPLAVLRSAEVQSRRKELGYIGTSVHSLQEAQEALACGADYLVAGHIFTTSCKPGLPPRGVEFLREICSQVSCPVYAIGGIRLHCQEQQELLEQAGAKGGCIMSGYMEY